MKGFLRSKFVLYLVAVVLLAGTIAVPLAGNFIRAHAQAPIPTTTVSQHTNSRQGHLHFMSMHREETSTAPGPLIYSSLHGPVMQGTSTIYAIFWEPPKLPDGTSTYVSTNYNSLIQRYFNDVGSSGLYNNNTQYYQITNGIANYIVKSSTLGGAWVDTSPYPSPSDCTDPATPHGCMTDLDIQNEVKRAMSTNSWTAGLTHLFYVFTSWGEGVCNSSNLSQCSLNPGGFCGYHTNFSNNGTILYAYIPYLGTISNSSGCSVPQSPNNDLDADRAINGASHEQMDAVTDPLGTAWFDSNGNALGEIADKCIEQFGSVSLDGGKANVQWNGHYYIVQEEWSNAINNCTVTLTQVNWDMFGYNAQHTHLNPNEHLLTPSNVSGLALDWTAPTGTVAYYNSPVVANGVVYIGSDDTAGTLYAFDAATSTLRWKYATGYYIVGSPAIANGIVYVASNGNKLFALKATTGKLLWTYTIGTSWSSPTVANGIVYITDGSSIYALNAKTGGLLWTIFIGTAIQSSPAVANGIVYVGTTDGVFYAFDATSGAALWYASNQGIIDYAPTVANGMVYFASWVNNPPYNSTLYAFKASGCGGTSCSPVWTSSVGSGGGPNQSSPAVANGIVYFGSQDGTLYALKTIGCGGTTCSPVWTWKAPGGSSFESSPAVANGILFDASVEGTLYAINVKTHTSLWTYSIAGSTESSPAVVNGVVYIGSSAGDLYAFHLPGTTP